jgi:hypothetical protein
VPKFNPNKYDQCQNRSIGHRWFLTDVTRASSFGTPVWHMCEVCLTVRKRIIDRYGNIAAKWYDYPEGYKNRGTGRIPQNTLRLQEIAQFRKMRRETKVVK